MDQYVGRLMDHIEKVDQEARIIEDPSIVYLR